MKSGQCSEMSTQTAPLSRQGSERRATLLALKIWSNARECDDIPILTNLTERANMAEPREEGLTENQFLIMFEPYSSNSVVIFYGGELPDLPIRSSAGKNLRQTLPAALRDLFHDACMEVDGSGDTAYRGGTISTPSGAEVLYRSIFMPLRSAGHPDRKYIFGVFSNEDGGGELLAAA